MAKVLLPDLKVMVGSIFTPVKKTNNIKPKKPMVSITFLPFDGKTLSMNAVLRPRIEGPKVTPPWLTQKH